MKKWFIDRFLPMWARQTVLIDNRRLARKVKQLQQENEVLAAYARGLEAGLRGLRRIKTGGNQ